MTEYDDFVSTKLSRQPPTGIPVVPPLHSSLFPHQADLVRFAIKRGRAAIFAATGLGKTAMQLEWARVVAAHTGGRVLILAPLAVAAQTVQEGKRLRIDVHHVRDGSEVQGPGLYITNYDRLHRFDELTFDGVVLDESSIIKHHTAKTLRILLDRFAGTAFKLCATATPSPNDYTELGTHAEFLGICTRTEMLAEYFCHDGGETQVWRLKGHARAVFWKWVSTWGALVRSPADLGYDDDGYALPPLTVHQHTTEATEGTARNAGLLFVEPAQSLSERQRARKASLDERVAAVVERVTVCTCGAQKNSVRTTTPTSTCGSERRNSPPPETPGDAIDTLPTPTTAKRSRRKRAPTESSIPTGPESKTCAQSDSAPENTNSSSPSRVEGVPSAVARQASTPASAPGAAGAGSTSTTITPPDASEGCSVPHAISDSGSLPTTPVDSNEQPCTCDASQRWVVWCDLNAEQDALAKAFGDECFSVYGALDYDEKESRLDRFVVQGERRILLGKPSIFGFGLNLQSCARVAFVGITDSWEAYHQAIRRCWRFGQARAVDVHVFASELEGAVVANLQRKEEDAGKMAHALSLETREAVQSAVRGATRETNTYAPGAIRIPAWLTSEDRA